MDRVVRTGGPPAEQALWMAWGSGVFAMVGLIEGVSAMSGSSPLVADAAAVPWWASWMAASASAEASAWLTKRAQSAAVRRPVEHSPPWERLGGTTLPLNGNVRRWVFMPVSPRLRAMRPIKRWAPRLPRRSTKSPRSG